MILNIKAMKTKQLFMIMLLALMVPLTAKAQDYIYGPNGFDDLYFPSGLPSGWATITSYGSGTVESNGGKLVFTATALGTNPSGQNMASFGVKMNALDTEHRVVKIGFKLKPSRKSSNIGFLVGYFTSGSNFTTLGMIFGNDDLFNSGNLHDPIIEAPFSYITKLPQNARIAFQVVAGATNMIWYLDDLYVQDVVPTGLDASDITYESAVLNWNTLTGISEWQLEMEESYGTEVWNTVGVVSDNTYTLTGLAANTTYRVRLAAKIGDYISSYALLEFTTMHAPVEEGNHAFSVGDEGQQVYLSPGNLQYKASDNIWRFAINPWDCVGEDNANISSTYDGWIDLFGWGTSGYNHGAVCYQPWSTSDNPEDYWAYGNKDNNLFDENGTADWGFNAISNGGNLENSGWRSLTIEEWMYLLKDRVTPSGILYAKAQVNGVNGLLLFPDDWDPNYYSISSLASFTSNTITFEQWNILEQRGVIFLPSAGRRDSDGTIVNIGNYSEFWTSNRYYDANRFMAWIAFFAESVLPNGSGAYRYKGLSVRLARSVEQSCSCSINATYPWGSGIVVGAGPCQIGSKCTVTAVPNAGYTFVNWTEDGVVVSEDPSYTFVALRDRYLVANMVPLEGALQGKFSVAEGSFVTFSQGNLQYVGSAGTPYWKFADNQWDYLGVTTEQNSYLQNVDRDLFGWGTSGYDHGATCYQPWSTSTSNEDYYAYGSSSYNLFDQTGQADWGYNAIANGGDQENIGWRTLTSDEWGYLFNTRTTPSGIRFAMGQVNAVNGMILLPDDWKEEYYPLNSTNSAAANYSDNVITASQWATLEQHGAVFLPAAGYRGAYSVYSAGSYGNYWSSSQIDSNNAKQLYFHNAYLDAAYSFGRYSGNSVRLVHETSPVYYTVSIWMEPSMGGMVLGAGYYQMGDNCRVEAIPHEGYVFSSWTTLDGAIVSEEAIYNFTVEGDTNLKAVFVPNTQTQTLALSAGANYVSFNVEITLEDLQTALTDALGTTGVTMSIKSQTQYTELKRGHWTTGFTNFNISEMFIVKVSAACEITLTGALIDPAEHPVTMVHGANWIAYPLSTPMTITDVFTGFVGSNDALTSQTQFSKYIRGKWSTEIVLQPGQGYIYQSPANEDRTFVFPTGE